MKHRNPLSTDTLARKKERYMRDITTDAVAYTHDEKTVPLKNLPFEQVEFIAGLWRVQKQTDYLLTRIRDGWFVLGNRIDKTEKNRFEYYELAAQPVFNCYGAMDIRYDMVAAHYPNTNFWAYGKTVSDARAFLSIALFDAHIDMFHAAMGNEMANYNVAKR